MSKIKKTDNPPEADDKVVVPVINEIMSELLSAEIIHPDRFNSMHEGYAIILEELDEVWEQIKRDNQVGSLREMKQVAAMAIKFLLSFRE